MTNIEVVREINRGFAIGDPELILSHLAEDVVWMMYGGFHTNGKEEYRKMIHNEEMDPNATLTISNEMEDGNRIVMEGFLECKRIAGGKFEGWFADFYEMEGGKVKEMRSYVIEKK